MVICSSISETGRSQYAERNNRSTKITMAPKPHSLSNYNNNKQQSFISKTPSMPSSKGFRLQDNNPDDNCSIYSLYKQKIDAMFTESNSIYNCSESINNAVQARIEKMFSEIEKDHTSDDTYEMGSHCFTIDYLGSIPLGQKVTSLVGLQEPLKELYFAYRKNIKHKKLLTGRLEISQGGLKVCYQGERGDLEQLNTFPTIAVWSAVKFVLNSNRSNCAEYAFLPLITDPDNINKNILFRKLDSMDQKYITNDAHSPLFAVVMRKIGIAKQLECHAFVCQTSEDAIVIAATLYKSLMTYMNRKNKQIKPPKNRNGISCISIASTNNDNRSYSEIKPNIPVRPPRKKRTNSNVSSTSHQDIQVIRGIPRTKRAAPKIPEPSNITENTQNKTKLNLDAIVPYPESSNSRSERNEEENRKDNLVRDFNESQKNNSNLLKWQQETNIGGFQRAQSIRKSDRSKGILSSSTENTGDILTKVTIPRSGSFLNAKGLTKYKSTSSRNNGQQSGGSPLGFHELFNEFRVQEGLNSLDEILGAIIDAEGMSFNDLKPIYKEFLLKLALTLTKDELYQRSKSIMRRQKRKLQRRNSSNQNKRKKMIIGAKGLRKIFRRSISVRFSKKFRTSKNNTIKRNNLECTLRNREAVLRSGSSISTSSYDARQFLPKEAINEAINNSNSNDENKQNNKTQLINNNNNNNKDVIPSTSEESDFFSLQRNRQKQLNCQGFNNNTQNRNSSSGYVSCSECSYDSDSCTCVSADKCYCSLGQKNDILSDKNNTQLKASLSSCQSEDKCYCSLKNGKLCKAIKNSKTDTSKSNDNNFYHSIAGSHTSYSKKKDVPNSKVTHKYYNDIAQLQKQTEVKSKSKKCLCLHETRNPESSLSWCGCDTDSCTDSNKCYCQQTRRKEGTIFDQLKQRGFIPSTETIITPPFERKLSKKTSNNSRSSKSSKSLEYVHNPENNPSYYEQIKPKKNLPLNFKTSGMALDYELFTISNSRRKSFIPLQRGKPSSEYGGFKSVFKASDSMRSYDNGKTYSTHNPVVGGNPDALSVKKSAEIAALFADVKLSQTTDITHLMSSDCESDRNGNLNARISSHLEQQRKALLEQQKQNYREIFSNNFYNSKSVAGSVASRNSATSYTSAASSKGSSRNSIGLRLKSNKNDLYSAKNGLYTIQSQSDDSRHSSANEHNKNTNSKTKEYFEINPEYVPTQQSISSNLENSLGYLP